ncbi:DUF4062 domain-containing protein [Caproiciproducens sp.]|uniref:DUF4062 domain-containing protein n=1 Tax=Caproiciproducens sp. TaxID=1954376 RepID=UPI00289B84D8|nr:DUF4062 domain-containing protein [Caproiciproducens sp.]
MDKRYQVFVSSTYEDLKEERKEVMQTLLEMDCIPCGMELFPASNESQWSFIKSIIDDCDYYILISGGRYGSVNSDGMGYTEMEYRYAVDSGKPVAAFVIKDPQQLIGEKIESTDEGKAKLKAFRELVQKKLTKYWTNKDDLAGAVSLSMNNLIRKFPAIGWIKADEAVDEKSIKEIMRLQKENEELKMQFSENITRPPQGVEKLSQEEDRITISLQFTGKTKNYVTYNCSMPCEVSWNDIYSALSPHLTCEDDEYSMKIEVINYLKDYKYDDLIEFKKKNKFTNLSDFMIQDTEFQKIKIQFKALGLIKQSIKNRSVKDKSDYWTLTPYGDFVMTQLIAIKKR